VIGGSQVEAARANREAWVAACVTLPRKAGEFRDRITKLHDGFTHLENVWRQEAGNQDAVVQAAGGGKLK
jgi:hypothetical protein